jgi:hypothetical protein
VVTSVVPVVVTVVVTSVVGLVVTSVVATVVGLVVWLVTTGLSELFAAFVAPHGTAIAVSMISKNPNTAQIFENAGTWPVLWFIGLYPERYFILL